MPALSIVETIDVVKHVSFGFLNRAVIARLADLLSQMGGE
jgi:hypothetical protein